MRFNERDQKTFTEMNDVWITCPECYGCGNKGGGRWGCSCCHGSGKINRDRIAELYVSWTNRAKDGANPIYESRVRMQHLQEAEFEILQTAIGYFDV